MIQQSSILSTDYPTTNHGNITLLEVPAAELVREVKFLNERGLDLKLIDATDETKMGRGFVIWYVFGIPQENTFIVLFMRIDQTTRFASLSSIYHNAFVYEQKIATLFGLTTSITPDARRSVLHENWPADVFPLLKDFASTTRPPLAGESYEFHKVRGEGVYEIPVGPVHAGIIEPGHFRFSVAGEEIILLEARLGYTHKGSEKMLEQLPLADKVRLAEKISGDSSFGHSLAFCQAIETLAEVNVPPRAAHLRTVYAELERIANHFGDIGAIMLDTGYSFGGSQGSRLRESIMRINERLTGSRFLRGCNVVGGVTKDVASEQCLTLIDELDAIATDFREVVHVAENSVSLLNRLKGTGQVSKTVAEDYGALGIAARACGMARDTRLDYPYAAYSVIAPETIALDQAGDVLARFVIRVQEVYTSLNIISRALSQLPDGPIVTSERIDAFKPNAVAISLVEGWRGEILYFVTTDDDGFINRVAVRDPSFINWQLLSHAAFRQMVPDFPLINKSFNLSYSGNDL